MLCMHEHVHVVNMTSDVGSWQLKHVACGMLLPGHSSAGPQVSSQVPTKTMCDCPLPVSP